MTENLQEYLQTQTHGLAESLVRKWESDAVDRVVDATRGRLRVGERADLIREAFGYAITEAAIRQRDCRSVSGTQQEPGEPGIGG